MSATFHFAVYNGREHIGSVCERDGEFTACGAKGAKIGNFATLKAAADAVIAKDHAHKRSSEAAA